MATGQPLISPETVWKHAAGHPTTSRNTPRRMHAFHGLPVSSIVCVPPRPLCLNGQPQCGHASARVDTRPSQCGQVSRVGLRSLTASSASLRNRATRASCRRFSCSASDMSGSESRISRYSGSSAAIPSAPLPPPPPGAPTDRASASHPHCSCTRTSNLRRLGRRRRTSTLGMPAGIAGRSPLIRHRQDPALSA